MEWTAFKKQEEMTVIPKSWIHIHYYDALNTLFRIENSLRVFVFMVLKNEFFDKWCDITITSDDAATTTIAAIAKKRKNQAQDFGYLGYGISCPMMHLTSGELIRIITNDSYWEYFKPYFPASKQVIKHKLDEIGVIRNSLAHFRPLKSDDIELIKQNANHALSGVNSYLLQLGLCFNTVPTNTQDDWYLSLSTLGTELCLPQLRQCEEEIWVCLTFTYKAKILSTVKITQDYIRHSILNLITPSILENYTSITKYSTCLTERVASAGTYNPENPSFSKPFSIYFNREVIKEHYDDIKKDVESLLHIITEETELISNDNLARGKLISVAQVYASLKEGEKRKWWSVNADDTLCPDTKGIFPEYWGDTFLYSSMITKAQKYPWMPIGVSEFEF